MDVTVPINNKKTIEAGIRNTMTTLVKDNVDSYYTSWKYIGLNPKSSSVKDKYIIELAVARKDAINSLFEVAKKYKMAFIRADISTNMMPKIVNKMISSKCIQADDSSEGNIVMSEDDYVSQANILVELSSKVRLIVFNDKGIIVDKFVETNIENIDKDVQERRSDILENMEYDEVPKEKIDTLRKKEISMLKFDTDFVKYLPQYDTNVSMIVSSIYRECKDIEVNDEKPEFMGISITGGNSSLIGLKEKLSESLNCYCMEFNPEAFIKLNIIGEMTSTDGILPNKNMITDSICAMIRG
jgi:hypothetical protein